jgi:hypothetical protein
MSLSSASVENFSDACVTRSDALLKFDQFVGDSEISQTPYLYSASVDLLNFPTENLPPVTHFVKAQVLKRVRQSEHSLFLRRPAAPLSRLPSLARSRARGAALRPNASWQGWQGLRELVHNG